MKPIVKSVGILSACLATFYLLAQVGCVFFPALAHGCIQQGITFTLLYGLLYCMILLTLIIVPLLAIVFIRVTIIMPISKMIYGDGNTLDARLFGWFDRCWTFLQSKCLGPK